MALGTTGALIASAAIQAGTSAAGFAQAGKARKEMKKAEAEADKAMAAARKKLEVNYLAGLSIAKEPYELARENLLQRSAALTQAGVEGSTRGAAATAGHSETAIPLSPGSRPRANCCFARSARSGSRQSSESAVQAGCGRRGSSAHPQYIAESRLAAALCARPTE